MAWARRAAVGGSAFVVFTAFAAGVGAQDEAAAAALFDSGLAEMKAGHYAVGCPKLADSYRADPRPGVLFTLADCEAAWGKTASAVAHYEDFVKLAHAMPPSARNKARADMAIERIGALKPKVPTLAVSLPANAPSGTVVKRDGVPIGTAALGVALPADPGDHVITTQAPGGPETSQTVTLASGDRARLTVDVKLAPPSASTETASPPPPPTTAPAASPVVTHVQASSARKPIAFAIGGIGIAGIAAGAITGGLALSEKKTIDDNCNDTVCNASGKSAADTGKTLALVSTISFAAGAAAVAGAALLLLTDHRSAASARGRAAPVAAVGHHGGFVGVQAPF